MSQLPLFAQATETVLVDDARGRIVYTPDFLPAEVARVWFDDLRGAVAWEAQRRRMNDREVDVPRLVAHFRLAPEAACLPEVIRAAARQVIAATAVAFTSVGLNFYRDGRDSVAPHNDHLDEIAPGCPIALLSLGTTRRMTIRMKAAPRRVFHVDLAAGSLLLMSYETQLHDTHGVPTSACSAPLDFSADSQPALLRGALRDIAPGVESFSTKSVSKGVEATMISQSLLDIADSLLYVSALLANEPRRIDRVIDYFGDTAGEETVVREEHRRVAER